MWPGYFTFGGTEIINASRTEAYARHFDVGWFRPVYNEPGLAWLLDDDRYNSPLQDDAPWVDPDRLDSYDFYGVYPLEITGFDDSTVSATVVESVIDGGYVQKPRKGTRTTVFSAVLVGASDCAVEYGMRWLRSALTTAPCFNASYGVCGGADLCYLGCEPCIQDECEIVYRKGPIVVSSTNLATNPNVEAGANGWNSGDLAKYTVGPSSVAPITGTQSILSTRIPDAVDRTNLTSNPNLEANGTGWNSSDPSKYPVARSTVAPITGTASAVTTRQGVLDTTIGSVSVGDSAGARIPVTAGEQVTVGMDIKVENPPVVDATNLVFNPVGNAPPVTYWGAVRGTLSAGADYFRLTINDAQLATNAQRIETIGTTGKIPVIPGQTIRAAGRVRSSGSFPMAVAIQWLDAASAAISTAQGGSTATNPTTFVDVIEAGGVAPANAAFAIVQFGIFGTGPRNVGDTLDLQRVYVGTAAYPTPWFDGASAASGDYTYRWTGAVNASTSERVRANPPVKTVTATNAANYPNAETGVSGFGSGSTAVNPVPTLDTTAPISGTGSALYVRNALGSADTTSVSAALSGLGPTTVRMPVTPGTPVTCSVDVKAELAGRRIDVFYQWYDAANAASGSTTPSTIVASATPGQVYRVGLTATPPAGVTTQAYLIVQVRPNTGNATAGERVWMDNFMRGGMTYFDGDTPASGGNFYRWTGARHTSTSEQYTETPIKRLVQAQVGFDTGAPLSVTVNDVQPGVTTRAVVTGTVPAGATGMYAIGEAYRMAGSGNAVTGERVWFDNLVVERATTDGSYWDGSTPDTTTYDYRWTGAANASTSQRLAVTDTSAASLNLTSTGSTPYACTPGVPVTFAVDVRVGQANRTVEGHLSWVGDGTSPSAQVAGVSGSVVRLVVTGTPPAGVTQFLPVVSVMAAGVAVAGEQVRLDNLYVGNDPTGTYFDGSTKDYGNYTYAWTGTPNASTSERSEQTYEPAPTPTVDECYAKAGRQLHDVTTTVGPVLTKKMDMNDGGAAWTVTWTMVAANPAEFGVEQPFVTGFLDPAVEIPYSGGTIPEGGFYDAFGHVDTDEVCPMVVYSPVFDPTCDLLQPPPDVPTIVPTCFDFPANFRRYFFTLPAQYIPLWDQVVPIIKLSTKGEEARNIRLRFYADVFGTNSPDSDPCNFCGDIVISYIPPSSTLVLDGADHDVYLDSAGIGRRRADSLATDSTGKPMDWPEFSCGFGYVVTVDMPQQQTEKPIVDMALVSRII